MKKQLFTILFTLFGTLLYAQNVSFRANAPQSVRVGQNFYLTYEVNQQGSSFRPGSSNEFNFLQGPSQSSSTSISMVNGRTTQSMTITYRYVLSAKKVGTHTIQPGSIMVGGKTYTSNPVTINVVKGNPNQSGNQGNTSSGISDKDVYIRMTVNKKNVYEGEPIVASVKLYTKVQLQQLADYSPPQFDGFWREDLEDYHTQGQRQEELINGVRYISVDLSKFILIPQKSGELTIDPTELEVIALQKVENPRSRNRDPFFDSFFGRSSYERIKKTLRSNAVSLNVKSAKNADIVGDMKLSSEISATEVKANESIALKLKVSGKGNLKMLEPFQIDLPEDFEVFDPETTQNIKVNTGGISGTKTFEYLMIPRHAGSYAIPPINLTFLDTKTGEVKTASTEEYQIKVLKSDGSEAISSIDHSNRPQEDVKFLGKDIRYIKTNDFTLVKENSPWFGSTTFYLVYLLGAGGFVFLFLFFRKRRKDNEDVSGIKQRKAGAMARKRLKSAEQFMQENNSAQFYEELLQGMWGYLKDKLRMEISDLTKEKIRAELQIKQSDPVTVAQLIGLIEKCEMAQYAPMGGGNELSNDYQTGVEVISKLEGELK